MEPQTIVSDIEAQGRHIDEIEVTSRLINMVLDMPLAQQMDLLSRLDAKGFPGTRNQSRMSLKHPWGVVLDPEKRDAAYTYHIQNISRCGVFIETQRRFDVGEKLMLTFRIPTNKKLIKVVGEVARFQENGIGVKFRQRIYDGEASACPPPLDL